MIILFCILMVSAGVASVIAFIISLTIWSEDTPFSYPKIKFASFKKFYEINPNRWELRTGYVECKIDRDYYYNYEKFRFGYLCYWKYCSWRKQQQKTLEQEKHNKSMQRMMDAVKIDIANSEAEAKKAQAKLMEELRKQCNESEDTLFDLMKLVEEYKEKIW